MYDSNSKVSFIPKGPIARGDSFLERKRPQSAIGFLAIVVFMASAGSYAGLYFYNITLVAEITTRTEDIKSVQAKFSGSKDVAQAKIFRARAEVVKELLASHVVVSPVFTFLSDNTLESVMYENFLFTNTGGVFTLELSGMAPTYASLAYQADKLRERTTKELVSFSIDNITLNKFGNVNFALKMVFSPKYLAYKADYRTERSTLPVVAPIATSSAILGVETSTTTTMFPASTTTSPSPTPSSIIRAITKSTVPAKVVESNWWLWFKFW